MPRYRGLVTDAVVSVVPTFRPDFEAHTLVETLASVAPLLVSDDASPCTYDSFLTRLASVRGVQLVRHSVNVGIGRGLNEGLEFAQELGATWLLTADQDSTITVDYFRSLIEWAENLLGNGVPVGAVGAEVVRDASGPMTYPTRAVHAWGVQYTETDELIQSGTLWHVPSLARHGGFREDFGMDAIDAEACLGLRELGRAIVVAPGSEFHHQIGRARQIRIMGRPVMVTRHDPQRRLSLVRNRMALFPRELRQSPKHAVLTVRRALLNAALSSVPADRSGSPTSKH